MGDDERQHSLTVVQERRALAESWLPDPAILASPALYHVRQCWPAYASGSAELMMTLIEVWDRNRQARVASPYFEPPPGRLWQNFEPLPGQLLAPQVLSPPPPPATPEPAPIDYSEITRSFA